MDRPSNPSLLRFRRPAPLAGFGQVRFVLGLVCLGLAVCLLILWVRRHQMVARCDSYIADMDEFAKASRKLFEKQGTAPVPSGPVTVLPQGLGPYLRAERWTQVTPFGGNYHWLSPYPPDSPPPTPRDSGAVLGAVQVNGFPPHPEAALSAGEIAYLQERFSHSAVPGTKLIIGFNGWPICIVYATQ